MPAPLKSSIHEGGGWERCDEEGERQDRKKGDENTGQGHRSFHGRLSPPPEFRKWKDAGLVPLHWSR